MMHFIIHSPKLLFLLSLFLTACSSSEQCEDEKRAERFLEAFLFREGGCFTLFGDKPVTSMLIFHGDLKDCYVENLSEKALQTLSLVDDTVVEDYEAWKRFSKNLKFENFFFRELPMPNDPLTTSLYFVNIREMEKIYHKYSALFAAKTAVATWDELLKSLQKPNLTTWDALFNDHYLAGLLYGFGQENTELFCQEKGERFFSADYDSAASRENFPIPIYAVSKKDALASKYKAQREQIKKLCNEDGLLKITLKAFHKEK